MIDNVMDYVLNAPVEEVAEELKKLNAGELASFTNVMIMSFEQIRLIKDELLNSDKNAEELEETLKSIYITLQKIENVVAIARNIQEHRKG